MDCIRVSLRKWANIFRYISTENGEDLRVMAQTMKEMEINLTRPCKVLIHGSLFLQGQQQKHILLKHVDFYTLNH